MSITGIIGIKIDQTQAFSKEGHRIPLSRVQVSSATVAQVKSKEADGYSGVKLALGKKNKANKSIQGIAKKAGLKNAPRFLKEIRTDEAVEVAVGQTIAPGDVLKPGDIIKATGISKGKGYAGVVKKWNFAGGPRTHGQSDRERAPGAIGQSATPGRVYKGKKMSGRMGNEQVTVKNLTVVSVDDGMILVKGLIPGVKGSLVTLYKTGEGKKVIELHSDEVVEQEEADVIVATEESKQAEEPKEETEVKKEEKETAESTEEAKVTAGEKAEEEIKEEESKEVDAEKKEENTEEPKEADAKDAEESQVVEEKKEEK